MSVALEVEADLRLDLDSTRRIHVLGNGTALVVSVRRLRDLWHVRRALRRAPPTLMRLRHLPRIAGMEVVIVWRGRRALTLLRGPAIYGLPWRPHPVGWLLGLLRPREWTARP